MGEKKYPFIFIHVSVTMSRDKTDRKDLILDVFVKFTSIAMQEVKQQATDHGECTSNWDITMNLSINRKITEGDRKIQKDYGILFC